MELEESDVESVVNEAEEFEKKIALNPYDYEAHYNCVKAWRKEADLEKTREARERFSTYFPLTFEIWAEWIEDEKRIASDKESKIEILQLLKKAVMDYLSIELWILVLETVEEYYSEQVIGLETAREFYEEAIKQAGVHFIKGHLIWEKYRTFVSKIDVKLEYEVFKRQLSVSHSDLEENWHLFSK
ncbi:hypothetical protein O9G_004789, partial [Rozella allomycis CSF55]